MQRTSCELTVGTQMRLTVLKWLYIGLVFPLDRIVEVVKLG